MIDAVMAGHWNREDRVENAVQRTLDRVVEEATELADPVNEAEEVFDSSLIPVKWVGTEGKG